MTKKDYIEFARMISKLNGKYTTPAKRKILLDVTVGAAKVFSHDNYRFDWARFFSACEAQK